MKISLFLKKKEILLPTPLGWLTVATFSLGVFLLFLTNVHPFLAPTDTIGGEVLVIEGWIPDKAVQEAVSLFRKGRYRFIIVTGGPLHEGSFLKEYRTYAQLGAASIAALGVEQSLIVAVESPLVTRDRTLASALALRESVVLMDSTIRSVDLCSFDVHSRRSHLLFRRALGREFRVGIVAVADYSYDPARWWSSSTGFRNVTGEAIAYFYALIFSVWSMKS